MNSEQGAIESSGLEKLVAWKKSLEFARRIYAEVSKNLPPDEKWGLTSQLRRAAASIPANVAEGYGRFYYQEGVRFCYIARGSLYEVLTYLELAKELNYINLHLFDSLQTDIVEIRRIISGYISYLKNSKPGRNEPGNTLTLREIAPVYLENEEDLDGE